MGEFEQIELASFTAVWQQSAGSMGLDGEFSWQIGLIDRFDSSGYGPESYYGMCQSGNADCQYQRLQTLRDEDTGHVEPMHYDAAVADSMSFDARVGATYTLFGYIATESAEAIGFNTDGQGARVTADFGHTLAAGVTPESQQVTLDWQVPLAPVPEPRSALLMAAGAAALLALRRRSFVRLPATTR